MTKNGRDVFVQALGSVQNPKLVVFLAVAEKAFEDVPFATVHERANALHKVVLKQGDVRRCLAELEAADLLQQQSYGEKPYGLTKKGRGLRDALRNAPADMKAQKFQEGLAAA